jgi:hypothetical protein
VKGLLFAIIISLSECKTGKLEQEKGNKDNGSKERFSERRLATGASHFACGQDDFLDEGNGSFVPK